MHEAFATHVVFNQSPPFEDVNLFTGDRPLIEAVQREGGGRAVKRLTAFGAVCGSAEAFEQGRLANEFPPRLKPFDSKGRRLDTVEYHPAYHACMEISIKEGLHCSAWDHLAKPRAKPVTGANVVRSAGTYMAIQMEAGHQCPITMTCQFRDRPKHPEEVGLGIAECNRQWRDTDARFRCRYETEHAVAPRDKGRLRCNLLQPDSHAVLCEGFAEADQRPGCEFFH